MKIQLCTTLLALSLFAPVVGARSHATSLATERAIPHASEIASLRAHGDPSLESLRAGRIEAPPAIRLEERTELRSAENRSADLLEMRAGELTDREWTFVAVGALIVLILVLI